MRNFRQNKSGLVLVAVIAITFIFIVAIIGLVGMLSVNKIADAITPYMGPDVRASSLVNECRNTLAVSVVLTEIMLIVWLFVSAQRRESQEAPRNVPY